MIGLVICTFYMEMKMIAEFILIWKMTRSMQIVINLCNGNYMYLGMEIPG